MTRTKTTNTLIDDAAGVFLDVGSVGSSVRWTLHLNQQTKKDSLTDKVLYDRLSLSTELSLTDCSRSITWSGHGPDDIDTQLKKIKAAVGELSTYMRALLKAQRLIKNFKTVDPDGEGG